MSTKICIDTDWHVYGAPEVEGVLTRAPDCDLWADLGDNIEINNCLKKRLMDAREALVVYRNLVDISVSSNHPLDEERMPPPDYVVRTIEGKRVMFLHGHLSSLWSTDKGRKYVRKNKPGCGWLKFQALKLLNHGRKIVPFKLKDEQRDRIYELICDHKLDIVVMGHAHPKGIYREVIADAEVVIFPQGRSFFEIFETGVVFRGSVE